MDLTSKLSMYDFFAILLPGFLILLLLACLFCWNCNATSGISVDVYFLTVVVTLSYLVGIVYHKFIEYIYGKFGWRNKENCIKMQLARLDADWDNQLLQLEGETNLKEKYYEAYYFLMEKNCLNSILVLEAQFVLLRNMIPLLIIYAAMICSCKTLSCYVSSFACYPCTIIVFLFLLAALLIYIVCCIQKKIYYLVWEGYYFMKKQETK